MRSNIIHRALCAFLSVALIGCMFSGCKKTVRTSSTIAGTDGSEYVMGWDESGTDGGNVLNSKSGTGTVTSTTSGGGKTPKAFTPVVNYDVYKNIPKNVKQIKVLLWYTPAPQEQKVFDSFTKKYGIQIKKICTDNANYLTKLTTLVASNDAPDVAAVYDFPSPVIKGLFEKLDVATVDKGGAFDLQKDPAVDMNAVNLVTWNGNHYGINLKGNWHCDRPVVVINRTLFHNKGVDDPYDLWKNKNNWNWDTFVECAEKMTYKNNGIQIYGTGGLEAGMIYTFAGSTGTDLVSVDNAHSKLVNNFTNPSVISAVELVTKVRKSGWCVPRGSDWSMFTKGQAAMWVDGASIVKKGKEFEHLTDDWTSVPIPCPKGQNVIAPYATTPFGVPKGAKNGIAGSYFTRYLLDSNNWDIRSTFCSEEMYNTWVTQMSYPTCYYRMVPIMNKTSGLENSLVSVTWGNVNDVPTGMKSLKGSCDSAINTILNEMSNK